MNTLARLAILAASALPASMASAAIVDNGTIQLGIDTLGQLNVSDPTNPSATGLTVTGLRDLRTNYEATADGCLCEGWGAGIGETGENGFANNAYGTSNLTSVSFTSDATSATSVVDVGSEIRVTHTFAPATETNNLYRVHVTMENISGGDIADLRYTRAMDWDIEPTAFDEFVTIGGTAAASNVLYADDNGFTTGNPFDHPGAIFASGDQVDTGPGDHGARFDFGFGQLLVGDSFSFDIFYGAAPTEVAALNSLNAVGAEVYSLGQSVNDMGGDTRGYSTFIFGFSGVGGHVVPPVPVPASAFLLLGGLGMLGRLRRGRKSV